MGFLVNRLCEDGVFRRDSNDIALMFLESLLSESGGNVTYYKEYLLNPCLTPNDYICGNYYWFCKNEMNFFIATDCDPDENDPDEFKRPAVVNHGAMYGILIVWHTLYKHKPKPQRLSITRNEQRYTFEAEGRNSIVVDPDRGWLYNDTVPKMIVRRQGDTLVCEARDCQYDILNSPKKIYVDTFLIIIGELILKYYDPGYLFSLLKCKDDNKDVVFETPWYSSSHSYSLITIKPKCSPYVDKVESFWLRRLPFVQLLQAWESKLHKADAFTLVLLGDTIAFFEGEPME